MKKAICLIALLLVAGVASAKGPTTTREGVLKPLKERLDAVKVKEVKGLQNKITLRAGNLLGKFENSIGRLEALLAKVKERLATMATNGKDTVEATAKLPAAEEAVTKAKTSLTQAKDELSKLSTTGTTTRAAWAASKTIIAQATVDIKQAHAKIVEVIRAINK